MKAMILAAGLGTRLRPLTNDRPKALVEINGRTLLEITLTRLAAFGIHDFIVNVHHQAGQIADYLRSKNNFNLHIELSREDDLLLDTGGGLKKAAWFFLEDPHRLEESFLLHNVDVLSNIDFDQMLRLHSENGALATLAVQSRDSSRQLLFNDQLELSGRRVNNQDTVVSPPSSEVTPTGQKHLPHSELDRSASHGLTPLAFSGIHIVSCRIFPFLTESTPVFSIIDSYLRLAAVGHRILAFRHDTSYWRDLGRPSDLAQAALDLQQNVLRS